MGKKSSSEIELRKYDLKSEDVQRYKWPAGNVGLKAGNHIVAMVKLLVNSSRRAVPAGAISVYQTAHISTRQGTVASTVPLVDTRKWCLWTYDVRPFLTTTSGGRNVLCVKKPYANIFEYAAACFLRAASISLFTRTSSFAMALSSGARDLASVKFCTGAACVQTMNLCI